MPIPIVVLIGSILLKTKFNAAKAFEELLFIYL
jgi:hypothetical protein